MADMKIVIVRIVWQVAKYKRIPLVNMQNNNPIIFVVMNHPKNLALNFEGPFFAENILNPELCSFEP